MNALWSHMWMSHGHTYERFITTHVYASRQHLQRKPCDSVKYEWVMVTQMNALFSHMWMGHGHTYEWVIVTHINESWSHVWVKTRLMCVPWLIHLWHDSFHDLSCVCYGVATISRLLKIIGLFCRIQSLLWGSSAKETCNFKEPTNRSLPIWLIRAWYAALHACAVTHSHVTWLMSCVCHDSFACDRNHVTWVSWLIRTWHAKCHVCAMGWLCSVGSLKYTSLLHNIGLFCRALLQKRPMFLGRLLCTWHAECHVCAMGWLCSVGSLKYTSLLHHIGLFCRALLQKRPTFLGSLLRTWHAECHVCAMGWLWSVGSSKTYVSFAEHRSLL